MYESFPVHPSARCFFFQIGMETFIQSFIHSFIHPCNFSFGRNIVRLELVNVLLPTLTGVGTKVNLQESCGKAVHYRDSSKCSDRHCCLSPTLRNVFFLYNSNMLLTWLLPTPLSDPPNNRQKRRSVIIVKKLKSTLRSGASLDNLDKENSIVNSPVRTQPDTAKGINSPNRIPPDAAKGLIVSLNHKGNCRSLEEGAIGGRGKRRQRGMSSKGSSARYTFFFDFREKKISF